VYVIALSLCHFTASFLIFFSFKLLVRQPLTWATVFGLTVVGGAFLYYYTSTAKQLEKGD
jgi:hypothetical protein